MDLAQTEAKTESKTRPVLTLDELVEESGIKKLHLCKLLGIGDYMWSKKLKYGMSTEETFAWAEILAEPLHTNKMTIVAAIQEQNLRHTELCQKLYNEMLDEMEKEYKYNKSKYIKRPKRPKNEDF